MNLEDTGDLSRVPRSNILCCCQICKSVLHFVAVALLAREYGFSDGRVLRAPDIQVGYGGSHLVTEGALDAALISASAVFEEVSRSTLVEHFYTSDEILFFLRLAIRFQRAAGVELQVAANFYQYISLVFYAEILPFSHRIWQTKRSLISAVPVWSQDWIAPLVRQSVKLSPSQTLQFFQSVFPTIKPRPASC